MLDGQAQERNGGLRILLVAENISLRLSGETVLPYHYLRRFLAEGHEVRVLCHARVRDDLVRDLPPAWLRRITFVEDVPLQRWLFRTGRIFPHRVEDLVVNQLIQIVTQRRIRAEAKRLVAAEGIDVVFQPAPIAARAVSLLYGLGAPVVIGPMSGGMDLPPAFRRMDGRLTRLAIAGARAGSGLIHRLLPGKLRAAALIVANSQTRAALPPGVRGRIHEVLESAVDLERWQVRPERPAGAGPVSFIFCGRFVDWKGIGLLVRAFAPLARERDVRLDLIGDGPLFEEIRAIAEAEGVADRVILHGRLPIEAFVAKLMEADVFVSPSLRECGGIAMMEAMAVGVPVIGVDWGGAALYAGRDAAILVDPASEEALVAGLTGAMRRLADSPEERRRLAQAGRQRLETMRLGWDSKARDVLAILAEVAAEARRPRGEAAERPRAMPPARSMPA